ncbi:MAG: dihydroorotate dehydrogenase electron transfer subunit [Heliobacteriaceae bacterium]|jgi:dihydroorotate dehydrogenase electron transfer subunit|nr:dihydroorotate dehydrogenase electron transfer subunit [Heliobacteriaceae bacterium]
MKKIHKGIVKTIKEAAKNTVYMSFEPENPMEIKPGQFISILCGGLTLRRPFSAADFDGKEIAILFRRKGKGTNYLSGLKPGSEIDFIGALGNGFDVVDKKSLIIGAGIGIAPVSYLKKKLDSGILVGAFMSKDEAPQGISFDEIITNDGSAGKKGSILDHLENLIDNYKPEIIYACGPAVVLRAVGEAAQRHGADSQLAMEKVMACGIGVCKGCVIKVKRGGEINNMTVCSDGPVFRGSEVLWE